MFRTMTVTLRLGIIIGAAFIAFVLLGLYSAWMERSNLYADRLDKTRSLVDTAISVMAYYDGEEKAGRLSHADAQKLAGQTLRNLRYDGKEYFFVFNRDLQVLIHAIKPELEGKSVADYTDALGKFHFRAMRDAAVAGGGAVDYVFQSATVKARPKISYAKMFEPWGWIVGTGIWTDDVDQAFAATLVRTIGFTVLAVLVIGGLAVTVARSIVRQLGGEPGSAAAAMRQVAAGDLTTPIRAARADSLMGSLAGMTAELRSMVAGIVKGAKDVADEAQAIRATSEGIAQTSEHQADRTQSIAAAIEELTVSVSHIAESAAETERVSAQTASMSEAGAAQVASAVEDISKVAATVREATEKMRRLAERADQVGSIAAVINDIAAQTNLLALNAAIEAARAGEQGRGFAVVADEVRGLAERTAAATVQIRQTVGDIQSESAAAVTAMAEVVPEVERSVAQTGSVGDALRTLRDNTRATTTRSREVADATREQSAASTTIAQQVEQISGLVEETNAAMHGAAEGARRLESLARDLHQAVARFQV